MNEQSIYASPVSHFRIALPLAVASMISVILMMPYLFAVMPPQFAARIPVPLGLFAAIAALQTGVLFLLLGWTGLRLGYAYGLDSPLLRNWQHAGPERTVSSRWLVSIALGFALGAAFLALLPPEAAALVYGPT